MKFNFFYIFIIALYFDFVFTQNTIPRYPLQKVEGEILIDGSLVEEAWKSSPEFFSFVDSESNVSKIQTHVKAFHQGDCLYLGVTCEEPEMSKMITVAKVDDRGVEGDDCIIVTLSPNSIGTPHYRFLVNSTGLKEDGNKEDPSNLWSANWEVKTTQKTNAWIAEFKIPLEIFKATLPQEGQIWRINFYRNRAHAKELSSWSNTLGGIHETRLYGELIFLNQIFLKSVQHTILKKEGEGFDVKVNLEGNPNRYQFYTRWKNDGVEIKPQYPGVVLTKENNRSETSYFNKDQGDNCATQFQIGNADGTRFILYRSSFFNVKTVDEREKLVNQIKKLFEQMKKTALGKDYLEGFSKKIVNLDSQSLQELRFHLQSLRVENWKYKTKPLLSSNLYYYTTPPLAHNGWFLPETRLPDEWETTPIGSEIKLTSFQKEIESACINVLNISEQEPFHVGVESSDLKSESGDKIPRDWIDFDVLKNWYQAGRGGFQSPDGKDVYTSELLLKEDQTVLVDDDKKINQINQTGQPLSLSPVAIPPLQSRQIYLHLKLREPVKPGFYRGKIRLFSKGKSDQEIPIQVQVLSSSLDRETFIVDFYVGREIQLGGIKPMPEPVYEAHLKLLAEYGITSLTVIEDVPTVVENGEVKSFDFTQVRKAVRLRKKYGLEGSTMVQSHLWGTPGLRAVWGLKDDLLDSEKSKIHEKNWKKFCVEINQIFKEEKMSAPLIYCWDEPAYDTTGKKLLYHRQLVKWTREAGALSIGAITLPAMLTSEGKVDPLMQDYPIFDTPSIKLGVDKRALPMPAFLYWHPKEHPSYDRLYAGFVAWYGGYQGVLPWIYESNSWGDRVDKVYNYRQQCYIYQSENGPVKTIQFIGFSEGIKDYRILKKLERLVEKNKNRSSDPKISELLITANRILYKTPTSWVDQSVENFFLKTSYLEFQALRAEAIDLIQKLDSIK